MGANDLRCSRALKPEIYIYTIRKITDNISNNRDGYSYISYQEVETLVDESVSHGYFPELPGFLIISLFF